MNDWLYNVISNKIKLEKTNKNIITMPIPKRRGITLHEDMHGSHLRKLQNQKFKLAYYESRAYKKTLRRWLDPLDRTEPILDVGAGDGRFTELLIEMGFQRIIATDINLYNLNSLHDFILKKNAEKKVCLIKCDVLDIPIKKKMISSILSIGVLYYLDKDYERGKKYLASLLDKGGLFIESEPDLEGQALKTLIFDNIEIFANIIKSHRFVEVYEGRSYLLRLFDRQEMINSFKKNGMKIVEWHGLSLFPLMFVIARARGLLNNEKINELESKINNTFDYFQKHGEVYKHILWLARKL